MRLSFMLLAGAAMVTAATAANASFVVYTSQASFLAAVSAPGVDTFTDLPVNTLTVSPITRFAGAYSYTASAPIGFFGAGSTANPWLSTNNSTDSIVFTGFASNVRGIGGNFFDSDFNGAFASGDITLTAVDATGSSTQTIFGATTASFLGFVSTGGLTSLTVSSVQRGPIWPTVDNLTLAEAPVAAAVPETATWGMMLAGFGMMGAALRTRRRSTTVTFA